MQQYIDIHTHHIPGNLPGILEVCSLYDQYERANSGMFCSLGLHPWYLQHYEEDLAILKSLAQLPNVLAIGECGLDRVCATDWTTQVHAFKEQVMLAKQLGKPLIIHCVRAYEELIKILDECAPQVPVIIHGFNKKSGIATQLLAKGYYLSFGASILSDGMPSAAVLKMIEANKFFLETDDSPSNIKDIYIRAAAIRETTLEAIILQVQQNFKTVFRQ